MGIHGLVSRNAAIGLSEPVLTVEAYSPYPAAHRDTWDEFVLQDSRYPEFELSAAARRRAIADQPVREQTRRTPEDDEASHNALTEMMESPLRSSASIAGASMIADFGYLPFVGVQLVTDEMRHWLRETPQFACVYPIIRRALESVSV